MANPIYAQLCQNVISTANFLETNQSEIEEAAELQQQERQHRLNILVRKNRYFGKMGTSIPDAGNRLNSA